MRLVRGPDRAPWLWAIALGAALALGVATLVGCPGKTDQGIGADPAWSETPPVDTALLAYLSAARAMHHEADLREDGGDIPGAVAAMTRLVNSPTPRGDRPEVDEVRADAFARLAELHLKAGSLDPAARAIESGLTHAREATYFRGHLIEVQGILEEARYHQLVDAGNASAAGAAKARAIALLAEAVRIQDDVIRKTMGDAGDAGRPIPAERGDGGGR